MLPFHENAPTGHHPRVDRPRRAPQPGAAPPPAPPARLRGDAGDDLARHQGPRPREARRRRCIPARRRRRHQPRNGAERPRACRHRFRPQHRARPAARGHPDRPRPGAGVCRSARRSPAPGSRRDHRRRRHDPGHRPWRPRGGRAPQAAEGVLGGMNRIVLAYSGGLETSIAIPWLGSGRGAEVIAVTVDLGQGKEVLEEIRDRALATGALRAHVVDARDAFARDYIVRALKAGILGERSPVAASLAHPLIAQKVVEIANIEQATSVAHGDPAGAASALDRTIRALDPTMTVFAPAGEWDMDLEQQLEYARERNVTLPVELSGLGDRTSAPRAAVVTSGEPASVDIAVERGAPVGVNGVTMPLLDLLGSLGIIAGAHGVASLAALHTSHDALEKTAVAKPGKFSSPRIAQEYLRLLRSGAWFTPARKALDAEADA